MFHPSSLVTTMKWCRSISFLIGNKHPPVPLYEKDEMHIQNILKSSPVFTLLNKVSLIRLVKMNGDGCFVFYDTDSPYSISFPIESSGLTPSLISLQTLIDDGLHKTPIINLHFRDYNHAILSGFPEDHPIFKISRYPIAYVGDKLSVPYY